MESNNSKTICPKCGKPKKPWFKLCWKCSEDEKQKPVCEICGKEVPEGHTLCKTHWLEKREQKKKLNQIDYVKGKKETDFREKFEGKFYFNGQKVKSKSELLLLYFFEANDLHPRYEDMITLDKEYRPDFIIDDGDNQIIVEHFGIDEINYNKKKEAKIKEYEKLCKENKNWFFIWTTEEDIYNLKDRLGKKLNQTPLNKVRWK